MLFDKNGFYKQDNDLNDLDFTLTILDSKPINIYSLVDGYKKGNMFKDLYDGYMMDKTDDINSNDNMLLNIQMLEFAINDLNLYLDLHPEDKSMETLFNDYIKEEKNLIMEYENKFGPFTVGSGTMNEWVNNKWPWEVDNV
jgi:spore coat protein JB